MAPPIEKLDLRLNCWKAATLIAFLFSFGGSTTIAFLTTGCPASVAFIGCGLGAFGALSPKKSGPIISKSNELLFFLTLYGG